MTTGRSAVVRVNLGCGPTQPQGWINVDGSLRARLARYVAPLDWLLTRMHLLPPTEFTRRTQVLDLRKPLPFKDQSVDAFYCGELLEHLLLEQTRCLLSECVRALRPGGMVRACVPDNYRIWKCYCNQVEQLLDQPRSAWPMEPTRRQIEPFFRDICVRRPWLRSMGHYHKWAFDELSLIMEFERAGLESVERRQALDSDIQGIADVEVRRGGSFLIVEGRKPLLSAACAAPAVTERPALQSPLPVGAVLEATQSQSQHYR
jgi:predicted SAM-dependent methyltransferase